ncbi:MAG: glycosyltransferase family 2 protein, partial [Candidatus Methylomirabilales bacterium]
TAKVARGGWRVYEVPISYFGRTYDEGKKITWKDGVTGIWYTVRYNLFR